MPIYVYRCTACEHEVEVIHGIDATGPAECDVCGGLMRKALTAPAIHFKGSGWAKKDAQAASKAKASKATGNTKSSDPAGKGADADGGSADGGSADGGDSPKAASGDAAGSGEAKPKAAPASEASSQATTGKAAG